MAADYVEAAFPRFCQIHNVQTSGRQIIDEAHINYTDNKDPLAHTFRKNGGERNEAALSLTRKLRQRDHRRFSKALREYSFGIDVESFFASSRSRVGDFSLINFD